MLACQSGAVCDPRVEGSPGTCGSAFTYVYFISFIFFCSFLVSTRIQIYSITSKASKKYIENEEMIVAVNAIYVIA